MIHYQLRCDAGHPFESWFRSSETFESQSLAGLIECPNCGSVAVVRGLMAPAIVKRAKGRAPQPVASPEPAASESTEVMASNLPGTPMPAMLRAALQRMRAEVERNCDHVGPRFAEEARAMHRGEAPERAIYGDTTPDQAEALADEGIEVARIPWLPRADG